MTDHIDFAPRPARTALLRVRVTQEASDRFADLCASRGISVSDAVREALKDWTINNPPLKADRDEADGT